MWDLMTNLLKEEMQAAFFTLFLNEKCVVEGSSGEFQSPKQHSSKVKKLPRFDESSASSSDLSRIRNFQLSSSSDISPQRTIEISGDSSVLCGIYSQKEKDGELSKQIAQKKASVATVEVIDETTPTEMPNTDDKCTVPSLSYDEMQGTCTYVKPNSNIDSSQESVDRSVEILSEIEELKTKISALEKENTKYKQETDYIEQCKACSIEIMKRHHEKNENKSIQKSATDSESKKLKHVSFESDCEKQMKEKSMPISGKEDDDPKIKEICKKEERKK